MLWLIDGNVVVDASEGCESKTNIWVPWCLSCTLQNIISVEQYHCIYSVCTYSWFLFYVQTSHAYWIQVALLQFYCWSKQSGNQEKRQRVKQTLPTVSCLSVALINSGHCVVTNELEDSLGLSYWPLQTILIFLRMKIILLTYLIYTRDSINIQKYKQKVWSVLPFTLQNTWDCNKSEVWLLFLNQYFSSNSPAQWTESGPSPFFNQWEFMTQCIYAANGV